MAVCVIFQLSRKLSPILRLRNNRKLFLNTVDTVLHFVAFSGPVLPTDSEYDECQFVTVSIFWKNGFNGLPH